jgi:hypothetical protein
VQVFGNGGVTRYITTAGEGSTYVQMGGGGQYQLPWPEPLAAGRNDDQSVTSTS